MILEFKYTKDKKEDLDKLAASAVEQMKDKKYDVNLDTRFIILAWHIVVNRQVYIIKNPDTRCSLFTYKDLKGKISVNVCGVQMFCYRRKREFICPRKRIY